MKDKIKKIYDSAREKFSAFCSWAADQKLPYGLLKAFVIVAAFIIAGFVLIKFLGFLYDSIYRFVNRHPLGVGLTAAGGGCFFLKYLKIKEESERHKAEQQRGWDQQKASLYKGCYETIATWLYTHVCAQPSFEELTFLRKPIRPDDFGSKDLDVYLQDGLAHFRFSIPKVSFDPINVRQTASVLQGMIQQQLRTYGLPPILQRTDCNKLIVEKVEDMNTIVFMTLILDWDDIYLKQRMYENTLVELAARDSNSCPPTDRDYHA